MHLSVISTFAEEFHKYTDKYHTFLDDIAKDSSPALSNMGKESPAGFYFLVSNLKRWTYNTGSIALLHDDALDKIVGISAVEHCSLSADIGSGGNRCWLLPGYRTHNEVTKFLLTSNLQWCQTNSKLGMLLTFNDYNKWIYNTIVKKSSGSGSTLGSVWSDWWNDCVPLPHQITLHYTPQWAVIKPTSKEHSIDAIVKKLDDNFRVQ